MFDFSKIPSPPNYAGVLARNYFGPPRAIPSPGAAGVNFIRSPFPIAPSPSPNSIPPATGAQPSLTHYKAC
jgi:hypothetical protein